MKLIINEKRCKGCLLCAGVCPYRIFTEGKTPGARGYILPVLDRPERCTNCRLQKMYQRQLCGMCQTICPDQAISWIDEAPFEEHKAVIEF
ncbi:MAG TPA: ferredoxin family protein [Methanocorpusculum sp.]|nr:ferredoxin family protein [Methanocorpusculum sp.]